MKKYKKQNMLILLMFLFVIQTKAMGSIYTSSNDLKVSILRFDKDMLEYVKAPNKVKANSLSQKYASLLPALAQTITNTSDQENTLQNLHSYFSHPALKEIYADAISKFDDVYLYNEQLSNMLSKAQIELEIANVPSFAFHVSGFKENTIYVNNVVSISIDKYMGSNYPRYKNYFNSFQLQQMTPDMITRDLTKAWLMAEYIKTETTNGDLLSEIIEQGKLLYALSTLLSGYSDNDFIGYTIQQENWCMSNHKQIWNNIVKQNHLYSTDRHIISAYFDDYSNSKINVKGSPAHIGSWIGFQIVKQYAISTNSSLKSILSKDARLILKDAKYKQ